MMMGCCMIEAQVHRRSRKPKGEERAFEGSGPLVHCSVASFANCCTERMPEVPDDILALIIDELQFDIDVDDEIDKTTARAVCLTCRRLLPFGRRLLYRTLKTRGFSSPQPLLPKAMAPRLLFAHLLEHPHLGSLVEELHYTEIAYPGTEDEVLDITELDK